MTLGDVDRFVLSGCTSTRMNPWEKLPCDQCVSIEVYGQLLLPNTSHIDAFVLRAYSLSQQLHGEAIDGILKTRSVHACDAYLGRYGEFQAVILKYDDLTIREGMNSFQNLGYSDLCEIATRSQDLIAARLVYSSSNTLSSTDRETAIFYILLIPNRKKERNKALESIAFIKQEPHQLITTDHFLNLIVEGNANVLNACACSHDIHAQ